MQDEKRRALGLGLQQIIQTDHQAGAILQRAKEQSAEIAAQATRDKAAILQDAQTSRETLEAQIAAEEAELLAKRTQQAQQAHAAQKQQLASVFAQHHDEWVQDIVARALGSK